MSGKYIFLVVSLVLFGLVDEAYPQNDNRITGTVTDAADNEPLPGVNIIVKGTTIGVATNLDGEFSITVPDLSGTLVFSYVGYQTREIPIDGRNEVNLSLTDNIFDQDLVVVGYGEQRRATLTGSVATMQTRELVQSPVSNISNSLVGRLPGLIAVQRSGEPGFDGSSIKIRGIGSLTAGSGSDPLILIDGVERGSMNRLDPNEIENISILKDASSTAVYGVRGANGVILITTKSGISGRPEISYSGNTGVQNPTALPEMLNSFDYASLRNEASLNMGQSPYFSEEALEHFQNGTDPIFHPNTDWYDLIFKDYSVQTQHNLNIRGGSDDLRYFISMGYFDQNGFYDVMDIQDQYSANPRYSRYNLRSNFDIDFNDDFSASVRLGAMFTDSNFPGDGAQEIFHRVLNSNPTMNPGVVDGRLITGVEGLIQSSGSPLSRITSQGYQRNFNSTLNSSVDLEHKLDFITEGLKVRGRIAYDNYYQHEVDRNRGTINYRIVRDPDDPTQPIFLQQGEDSPFNFSQSYNRNNKIYTDAAVEYANTFFDSTM
ncbi:MAG: SusC/RagA family TonB-linked outer membrane protein [Balneolales bacterium]